MKRRTLPQTVSLLLALALLFSCFTVTALADEAPMPIVLCLRNYSSPPDGWNEAAAELKRIALEEGNFDLEIICEASSTMTETLNMMLAGGETVDIFMAASFRYAPFVAQGMCLPMDDVLAEYGKDLIACYDEFKELLTAGVYNGELYGITPLTKKVKAINFVCRGDLLEKYNLSLDGVQDYKDLEPILEVIRQNEPNIAPLIRHSAPLSSSSTQLLTSKDYDTSNFELMGAQWNGVLVDDTWNVVNLFETEAYYDVCKTLHEWYKKGYMVADIATLPPDEQGSPGMVAGNAFAYIVNGEGNPDWSERTYLVGDGQYGKVCLLGQPCIPAVGFLVGIGATTSSPENAMKFMNFAWTNADFNTILNRGTRFQQTEDENIITLPEGVDYLEYTTNGFNDMIGNFSIAKQWDTDPENYGQEIRNAIKTAKISRVLGFSFDSSNVVDQMTACQNVYDEYYQALENGVLDPDIAIPEMNAKLKAAGLDDIIAEKQRQLDIWVEANHK